jgi:adenosylcobinamide kinase / adenosylcobinamide-phosphate guanylyltransferase
MGSLVLVTGGVRSGKSRRALEMASESGGGVLFVATALASDGEMVDRIGRHRSERPEAWRTVEALSGKLADALEPEAEETLVVDCLGLYVSRRIMEGASTGLAAREVLDAAMLATRRFSLSVFVSNEVGSGLVPDNELGRTFTEELGLANQDVARAADRVVLMVAGIPVRVK